MTKNSKSSEIKMKKKKKNRKKSDCVQKKIFTSESSKHNSAVDIYLL